MQTEKILFIAYQFPPHGGPGVLRSLQFVKHLPASGIVPVVLTRDHHSIQRGISLGDKNLEAKIPTEIKVIRVSSHETRQISQVLMKLHLYGIFRYLFYNRLWDPSLAWTKRAYERARREIRDQRIHVVYTSSAPFSLLTMGYKLKKKLGVRWIADLRDPWCDAYTWEWPSRRHWLKDCRKEKVLLNQADKIIVVTEAMKQLLLGRGIGHGKIEVIHDGFE